MTVESLRWTQTAAKTGLSLRDLATDWDRLNAERRDLPFLSSNVVRNALDVFGTGSERLLVGRSSGAVRAMFVLAPAGKGRWQTFQPSQLPLGCWVAARELDLAPLTGSLIRGPLGLCLALSITQIDPLVAERAADDCRVNCSDYVHTAWIDIEGSFDDYWSARGKNLRQNMRKQRNKLAAEGKSITMRVLRAVADMAPALERYGVLESKGWKAGEGTAIETGNSQGRFYRRLLEEAAACGEAVVYECLFDDQTVAMNLCLYRHQQLVVLKTTYDESIKALSPAFLLREDELKSIFSEGDVKRIEYYGKVMDWHSKLTENSRGLYHLTRFRWSWVQQLAARRRRVNGPAGVGHDELSPEAAQ